MSTYLAPPQSLPFELGEPAAFGGLALVPLFSTVKPRLEYIGLDEAVARGLAVTEVDEVGSVASLFVSNPLDVNVLLYEGEEFVGAKQNRILDRTLLVQGKSKTLVPVSCVERGRWAYRSSTFATAPRAAYPELRLAKREGGGQAQVWASAAAKSARLDAWSPTDASEEMYLKHGASLEEYVARLPRRDGQCGAIVCLGGRVTCLDFVGRSDVYAGLYAKLLRGYALDAIERPVDAPVPKEYVASLLRRIGRARRAATPVKLPKGPIPAGWRRGWQQPLGSPQAESGPARTAWQGRSRSARRPSALVRMARRWRRARRLFPRLEESRASCHGWFRARSPTRR
jgi:hypothetical protein